MIEIPLKGKNAQGRKAKIDDADLELVKGSRWTYHQGYAVTTGGEGMHRRIAKCTDRNRVVDHINGDRLDNTRENLRIVSRLQNGKTKSASRQPTEHEAVWLNTFKERYAVILYDQHRRLILGEYKTIEEATAVRDAEEKHGGYTRKPIYNAPRTQNDEGVESHPHALQINSSDSTLPTAK